MFSGFLHPIPPVVFEIGRFPLNFLRSYNYYVRSQKNMVGDVRSQKKGGGTGQKAAKVRGNSGPTPGARGGSRVKAPPLAVRKDWQVVDRQLLRLLSTNSLGYKSLAVNLGMQVSKMLFHWTLLLDSFLFCET